MSDSPAAERRAPAPSAAREEPAQRLWGEWREGRQPDVQEFVAQSGDLSADQLVAVLRVDQRERWQRGERLPAETYLDQFPTLQSAGGAVDLVFAEFMLREEMGEAPTVEEY